MDVEKMSNEELIFKYFYSGCDNAGEHATMAVEIQNRLRTSMHWLPMTEDAVFEDKAEYLIRVVDEPLAIVCTYRHKMQLPFVSEIMDYERKEVTHYARITEPK